MYSKDPGIPIVSDSTVRRDKADTVTVSYVWEAQKTKRNKA